MLAYVGQAQGIVRNSAGSDDDALISHLVIISCFPSLVSLHLDRNRQEIRSVAGHSPRRDTAQSHVEGKEKVKPRTSLAAVFRPSPFRVLEGSRLHVT